MTLPEGAFIVTGSSSGVGAATAIALAGAGAHAIAVNFNGNAEGAERVAAECRSRGSEVLVVRADVASDVDCRALAEAALSRWGRIDGLVNNAGVTRFVGLQNLGGLSAEDFQAIYAVNVVGAFQMARACEPALRRARGAIVNVSSIASQDGLGSSIAYAASKGALNALTLALARALGPEVRVNAVLPGFIETDWLRRGLGERYEAFRDAYRAQAALADVLSPEDVAETIVALLRSPKVSAQLLRVDAGRNYGSGLPSVRP